ncbi:glycosyl hydrolase family 95 catalytic domain-containing protein [Clostridium tarantellae]|uniref:Dockerin domain-containing protein n=1 Tax=Clostridium tarantellae TaxID=39493 RepID=A0A6I1MMC1_9CLOT|nr:glycoside hydrolase N-terminal domain-containing protein [Clostridium tarantellae]MPQ44646.1 hypothetical protein [Clostridium tarantellae]
MRGKFLRKVSLLATVALSMQSVYALAVRNDKVDISNIYVEQMKSSVNNKLMLWYDEAATNWETQALPIGNGHMGGMIFGGISTERIQYNEKTLWTGGPGSWEGYNGGNREGAWEAVQKIREILAKGETPSSSLFQQACGIGGLTTNPNDPNSGYGYGSYQNFGDIYLDFNINENDVTNYRRELDIEESISKVKYTYNGVNYTREYFMSYPDNVMVVKITADKENALSFNVRNEGTHEGQDVITVENNTIKLRGTLTNNGMNYESQIKVLNEGGTAIGENNKVRVEDANAVTIIMAAGTDYANVYPEYRGEDPHEGVTNRINNAIEKGYESLKERHLKDYKELFNRVELNLGELNLNIPTDDMLENYKRNPGNKSLESLFFQYGRYLLISSSREGSLPANLQGVWNNSNNAPWASDYHFNVNLQMCYWPAEVTNLSETAIPLVEYVDSLREPGKKTAKIHCGIDDDESWTVNTMNNPFGFTAMGWDFDWGWAPTSNAWISQNLWEHYQFTEDKDYLRDKIYPIMKSAATFWTKFLVEHTMEDGKTYLISSPSYSPEHGPRTMGTTFDQELIWQLFTDTIKASEVLEIDDEFRAELKEKRERLLKPKVGKHGQVQEWMEDIDDPNNTHRHISHLVGLYPGNQINKVDTPELFEAAKVTMNHRGDGGTGWSKANKINLWARLLDGDRAYKLLQNQLTDSTLSNLFDTHPPFQLDGNMGATSGIAEMLLQSHFGTINPLPSLPTTWADGSYKGLKARGNFEIGAQWNSNSLDLLTIKSGSGNDCYLEYPGITEAVIVDAQGNEIITEVVKDNVVKFKTTVDGEYTVNNIPKESPVKVEGLKVIRNDKSSVKLTWNDAKFAESYDIYRKGKGDVFELIGENISENIFIDENALENNEYTFTYYIVAKNSTGQSEPSEKVEVESSIYVSDFNWVSATTGYGTINKDKSCDGRIITLKNENGNDVTYEKGIGTHANSTIIYNISDYGYYDYFETFVGVDQEMAGTVASISFEVYLDGEKVFDSGLMNHNTPQKYIKVPIKNKSELKLIVKDGGNGIGSDHGSFGDAKLIKVYEVSNLGDFNKNGTIDIGDLSIVSKYYGQNIKELDLNGDGLVNDYELNFIMNKILN